MKDTESQATDVKVERLHAASVAPVAGAICLATVCACEPRIPLSCGGFFVFLVAVALVVAWAVVSCVVVADPG